MYYRILACFNHPQASAGAIIISNYYHQPGWSQLRRTPDRTPRFNRKMSPTKDSKRAQTSRNVSEFGRTMAENSHIGPKIAPNASSSRSMDLDSASSVASDLRPMSATLRATLSATSNQPSARVPRENHQPRLSVVCAERGPVGGASCCCSSALYFSPGVLPGAKADRSIDKCCAAGLTVRAPTFSKACPAQTSTAESIVARLVNTKSNIFSSECKHFNRKSAFLPELLIAQRVVQSTATTRNLFVPLTSPEIKSLC